MNHSDHSTKNIALLGTGFMGRTHLKCFQESMGDAFRMHTICSRDPENELKADGWGNIETKVDSEFDLSKIRFTSDWLSVINDPEIDAIDICLPTPVHAEIACAALIKGKHVLCEKPLALTTAEALQVTQAARAGKGIFMPAMVMRFWPEWEWLKQTIEDGSLGQIKRAHFVRHSATPPGWYRDPANSGGALIDLHIHDIDFIYYLFGMPDHVTALHRQDEVDHWMARYDYVSDGAPLSVTADGGWLGENYPFAMQFQVDFTDGDVSFNINREQTLLLTKKGNTEAIQIDDQTSGYAAEINYFLDCIQTGRTPQRVTAEDALMGLTIAEAESRSAEIRQAVRLNGEALDKLKQIDSPQHQIQTQ